MMRYYAKLKSYFNVFYYLISGKKPWTRGYNEYKNLAINEVLEKRNFNEIILKPNYGYRLDERIVEYPWFFSRLTEKPGKLLDAGSILNYKFILNRPELFNKNIHIITLAPESNCYWKKGVSYVFEDIRFSPYKNDYFDVIVSISTIEHIGLDNTLLYSKQNKHKEFSTDSYLTAIQEFKRMLKKDAVLYLTVPFGKHKNHKWFQIFDAPMIEKIVESFNPSSVKEFYYKYEPNGWRISSRDQSRDSTYFDIHAKNSYDKDFAAASRSIACLEMMK